MLNNEVPSEGDTSKFNIHHSTLDIQILASQKLFYPLLVFLPRGDQQPL